MSEAAPRVLIIDDEAPIVRVLRSTLTASGYRVSVADTGGEALSMIAQDMPDAILLDLGLPDMDGKEIIAKLREWCQAPIVVLSARHDEAERIAALDEGADDYVTKPFHMGELQARLRAALRGRERRGKQRQFRSGAFEIDFDKRLVTIEGEEIKLARKEFDLLRTLAQHAGQVVTHKQLLAAGWGGANDDTQFVRVYIGQLRQKLEADPSAPKLIRTEPGIGYRLIEEETTS
jgi:two-component system, OmpR family, KDP operon response regulator KdpE